MFYNILIVLRLKIDRIFIIWPGGTVMLPQTYVRTQRAKQLFRDFQTLAASSSTPVLSASFPSTPILTDSASTPSFQRESRRGHYVVKRRWWLPHIPDLDDVKNYPYNEHERGNDWCFVVFHGCPSMDVLANFPMDLLY